MLYPKFTSAIYENNKKYTKNRLYRESKAQVQSFKKQSFCVDIYCNFDGACEMSIINILFRHATKNFEINVSINVNKLKLENATTKMELVQN